jgi:hypothetical protein
MKEWIKKLDEASAAFGCFLILVPFIQMPSQVVKLNDVQNSTRLFVKLINNSIDL